MALGSDAAAAPAADDPGPPGGQAASVPQAPEELIEALLRTILESTQTSAGAVCLFDQHQELLRLAVEVGLSDEGCRRLRSVRRGAATTWDMPLHSLLNRRVYLIESASKNRYVPPLVDDVANVRAVACVPLYDGSTPVGSLILVALAPRSFGERQIRTLEQPVRDLVGHIVAMRKRVSVATPQRAGRPSLAAKAIPPAGMQVAGAVVPGPKTAPAAAASESPVQAAVDRARAELERLRARLAEAEDAAAAERRRADELDERHRALDTRASELHARASELQAERDRLADTLAARTNEVATLEDRASQLDTALAESRAAQTALRTALEQAQATASASDADATRMFQARIGELEAANEQLRGRTVELEAALVAAEARIASTTADADARLAAAVADAGAQHAAAVADNEARLAAALDAATETQRRCDALAAELDAMRAAAGSQEAQAEAVAQERARRDAELAAACEREAAQAQHALALAAELEHLRAAGASQGAEAEAFAQERSRWESELAVACEREAAHARRVAELEAELERVRAEGLQLRDGFAHLESLLQTEVDAEPAQPGAAASGGEGAMFEVVELDDTGAGTDDGVGTSLELETLVVEEVEPIVPAEPAPVPAAAPAEGPAPEGILVLDTEAFWTDAAPEGQSVVVLAPDAVGRLGTRPERLVVNLAVPHALEGLAAIRRAGIDAPCHACIVQPGQSRGVLVGRFELAARPIDPDALLAALPGRFPRGTRVVTAGADVDGLISLRQALARLGVSVSMAWDAKQAGDLLSMVHPEVAIIDLELPPKDGCALVARMGLVQPTPLTVIIPKPTDAAGAFAAALAHPELARATMTAKDLLASMLTDTAKRPAPQTGRR